MTIDCMFQVKNKAQCKKCFPIIKWKLCQINLGIVSKNLLPSTSKSLGLYIF